MLQVHIRMLMKLWLYAYRWCTLTFCSSCCGFCGSELFHNWKKTRCHSQFIRHITITRSTYCSLSFGSCKYEHSKTIAASTYMYLIYLPHYFSQRFSCIHWTKWPMSCVEIRQTVFRVIVIGYALRVWDQSNREVVNRCRYEHNLPWHVSLRKVSWREASLLKSV